jgi:ribosomal protein S18 acetylase RimI-like enzyme
VQVLTSSRGDLDRVLPSIVLAFATDPFVRWLFPASDDYLRRLSQIARIHAERVVEAGGVSHTVDYRGAAIWFPPGHSPNGQALGEVFAEAMSAGDLARLSALFTEIDPFHPPEPHWYLRMIGVDPSAQGRGHGAALLEHALSACDRDGTPAFLEATTERSVALYEQHGFEVAARTQVGDSPPLWPMRRPARRG